MDFHTVPTNLSAAQSDRLRRFGVGQSVDIHCHCLPGIDDGPPSLKESLQLCQALVDDGITNVIATPHQLGRYEGRNGPAEVREAVAKLQNILLENEVPLRIAPGGDVRVDHRLIPLLDSDRISSLADTKRYLLLELPHETYVDLRKITSIFTARQCTLIVSHPERNAVLNRKLDIVLPLLENGAVLQLTVGSLLGDFGSTAKAAAWKWLESGQAVLVATDAHGITFRPPSMTEGIDRIAMRFGEETAKRVCLENPLRVLQGEPLIRY